jgi:two-component system chemotaxis response regulator CheB
VTKVIRVLIVDDSAFVRRALARMLGQAGDIEIVGSASDGIEGIEQVRALNPDVVTLDIKMPRMMWRKASSWAPWISSTNPTPRAT